MYKAILSIFIIVITYSISFSHIKSHKRQAKNLVYFLQKARTKVKELKSLLKKARHQSKLLLARLKDYKDKLPIRYDSKYGYKFEYYDDGVIVYTSIKGTGIKVNDKRLFIKKNSLSYTLTDGFRYTEFLSKDGSKIKNIYLLKYHFWMTNISYGMSKLSYNGTKLYKYYKRLYPKKSRQEKLTILSNSLTVKRLNNKPIIYYNIGNKVIIVRPNEWIKYSLNKDDSYTYFADGNINISPSLVDKLFSKTYKSNVYIEKIFRDFPSSYYTVYARMLLKNKVPLNDSYRVYLTLINYARAKYNLKPLRYNQTLNRIAKEHGKYLLSHKPRSLHLQDQKKSGYFGRTSFQRRKYFNYSNKVTELIVYGSDYIRQFISYMQKDWWIQAIFDPRAIHFGYYNVKCKGLGSFAIVLIGRQSILASPSIIFYKSVRVGSTIYYGHITKFKGFCIKPEVEYKVKDNYLLRLLVYNGNIRVKDVVVSLSGSKVYHKIAKRHRADHSIYTIYAKTPLRVGKTYSVRVNNIHSVISIMDPFKGYRYLVVD